MSPVTQMGRLNLIALRKHDLHGSWRDSAYFWVVKKKSISNLHVVDMPLNEPTILFFFYNAVLPSQTCRIPDETKKFLGPKINTPNFQALNFFSEGLNDMAR